MADKEALLQHISEEADANRDSNDEAMQSALPTRPNRANAVMLSLRIPAGLNSELARLAAERDVPTSAFIRGLLLKAVAEYQADSVPAAIERVAAEVDRLRSLV